MTKSEIHFIADHTVVVSTGVMTTFTKDTTQSEFIERLGTLIPVELTSDFEITLEIGLVSEVNVETLDRTIVPVTQLHMFVDHDRQVNLIKTSYCPFTRTVKSIESDKEDHFDYNDIHYTTYRTQIIMNLNDTFEMYKALLW